MGWVRGVTDKDSSSNDFDIAAVTAPLVETAEAIELSSTIARITQWSAASAAGIQKIIAGGSISPDVGVAGSDFGGDKPMTAAEVGRMIQPALQTVVAQSLVPAGPQEIRSARVACSMAAWIYYLPTTHAALHRYGLRMVVSSLNRSSLRLENPSATTSWPSGSFTMAQMEEMKERSARRRRHPRAGARGQARSQRPRARDGGSSGKAGVKELSPSVSSSRRRSEKKAVREASSMFDGFVICRGGPKAATQKMDFDP